MDDAAQLATALSSWMRETALPFWAARGFDRRAGVFHERLLLDGAPDHGATRRVRVQARQIYVFAHASVLGWSPDGLALATAAFESLLQERACGGPPGFAHTRKPDGSVEDGRRDTYDHAFLILAFAWLARAGGGERVRAALADVVGFVETRLSLPDGTLREGLPDTLPRRQNPHMHMLEAYLALHETCAWPGALDRAGALAALLEQRFLLSGSAVLREFFTADWRSAPGPLGQSVEPGHLAEWSWLLRRRERLAAQPNGLLASRLADAAEAFASTSGVLPDEADERGFVRRGSSRLWPQTERAKAWIAEAEKGRPGARERAAAALRALRDRFLDRPFAGGWIDQIDAAGAPIAADVPASTLYHIFVAVVEGERVLAAGSNPS